MGTADPERAVAAASVVAQDVAGIDVNCGCPKKFSVVSAMGSALLEDPDRLESILRALSSQIKVPISCKIRMIPKSEDGDFIQNTVKFVKRIQDTGIKALGVHCRFTFEKPREPGHWEIFEHLSKVMTIPLIANGDFYSLEDIAKLQAQVPAVSSFLIARGAQWNPSVFRKEGPLPGKDMVMEYLDIATKYDMHPKNTKYVLIQFQIDGKGAVDFKKHLNSTKSHDEMRYDIGQNSFFVSFSLNLICLHNRRDLAQKYLFETEAPAAKRPRLESVM